MQAMILAAGQGRRLEDRRRRPKCLREVGGMPLVHHQMAALAEVGIGDVVIVVGYEHQQIRDAVGHSARYAVNMRYADTNSMYSFLLGRGLVGDDVLVMNSDLLFAPALLERLLAHDGSALLYDSGYGTDDEEMKVRIRDGRLVEMSKVMQGPAVAGENVGVLRLTGGALRTATASAQAIVAGGGERAWLAAAVNCAAVDHEIACVDVAGLPWVEIDFPEDLARARTEVFPAVARAAAHHHAGSPLEPAQLRSVS